MVTESLAERLRIIRKNRGLSMQEFGEMFDLHYTSISNYETGNRDVPLSLIRDVCEKFDVSANWLIFGSGRVEFKDLERDSNSDTDEFIVRMPGVHKRLLDIERRLNDLQGVE